MNLHQTKLCSSCDTHKARSEFNKLSSRKHGLQARCRECCREKRPGYHQASIAANPSKHMWQKARSRALAAGTAFTIAVSDVLIPPVCPILGTPMARGGALADYPSLDRIDNARGYVPGNVCVISYRANSLKSNATLEELRALVRYAEGAALQPNP